jgi:hypothetical protein
VPSLVPVFDHRARRLDSSLNALACSACGLAAIFAVTQSRAVVTICFLLV